MDLSGRYDAQLRHHAPTRRQEPHLQAFEVVEAADALEFDTPALPAQEDVDTQVIISDMCLGQLMDTLA